MPRAAPRTLPQRFGRAVRRLRERTGLSQDRFAAAAKIDRSYYSRLERGLANPSLAVIARLVEVLDVTFAELGSALDAER
jgi:transcriptional regulator with XRE-family HTH domain